MSMELLEALTRIAEVERKIDNLFRHGPVTERKKIEGFPYIYSALFDDKALAETAAAAVKPTSRLHRGMRR